MMMKILQSWPVQLILGLVIVAFTLYVFSNTNYSYTIYDPVADHGDIVVSGDATLLAAQFSQETSKLFLSPPYGLEANAVDAFIRGGATVKSEEYQHPTSFSYYLDERTVVELDVIIPAGVSAPVEEQEVTYSIFEDGCTYVEFSDSYVSLFDGHSTVYTVCSNSCGTCEVQKNETSVPNALDKWTQGIFTR
jgi:hypothetical protein